MYVRVSVIIVCVYTYVWWGVCKHTTVYLCVGEGIHVCVSEYSSVWQRGTLMCEYICVLGGGTRVRVYFCAVGVCVCVCICVWDGVHLIVYS